MMWWIEDNVFAPLFEDKTVTMPMALWILAVLAGVLGWVL